MSPDWPLVQYRWNCVARLIFYKELCAGRSLTALLRTLARLLFEKVALLPARSDPVGGLPFASILPLNQLCDIPLSSDGLLAVATR